MSFAITGLTNANEFYSQHYLDEILEKDLKSLFDQWKEQGAQSPVGRLRAAAGANGYFRARERFLTERKTSERASLFIDLVQPLLCPWLRTGPAKPGTGRRRVAGARGVPRCQTSAVVGHCGCHRGCR